MSAQLLGLAFGAKMGTHARKLVLLKLVDHCHDDGTRIFPAIGSLAEAAECDRRTVQRTLRSFVEIGLLIVVREGGGGPRATTEYALDLDLLYALARRGWDAVVGGQGGAGAAGGDGPGGEDGGAADGDDKGGTTPPLSDADKGGTGAPEGRHEIPKRAAPDRPNPQEPSGNPHPRDRGAREHASVRRDPSARAARGAAAPATTDRPCRRKGRKGRAEPDGETPNYHVHPAWSRGWWCSILQTIGNGDIRKANFEIGLARGATGIQLKEGKDRIPTLEEIGALVQVCATSPEWERWHAWFRARGVNFPLWDKAVWCWVPSRDPPGG